jgi:hypothetical protein
VLHRSEVANRAARVSTPSTQVRCLPPSRALCSVRHLEPLSQPRG